MSNQGPSPIVDANPLSTLRVGDHDRFVQVLLADPDDRPALVALFLLNLELARIPEMAREPMAGLIRLQWWRDALQAESAARTHPVLAFLRETDLLARLDRGRLLTLVDARERELDATPLGDVEGIEVYARATAGALTAAAAVVVRAPEPVVAKAEMVGTAYGLLGVLRALPFAVRRTAGPFRASLPPELAPLVRAAVVRAETLLAAARPLRGRRFAPALATALLARQDATRLTRAGFDPFDGRLSERPPWTMARCVVARAFGRYG